MVSIPGYYQLTTPGDVIASGQLTLTEAKSFLRVDYNDDDSIITNLIYGVTGYFENTTARYFTAQDWTVSFPRSESSGYVEIQRGWLSSVSEIRLWNDTTSSFAASTDYYLYPNNGFSRIIFSEAISDPTNAPFSIQVDFSCGITSIPLDLKQALLAHINFLYENRGDVVAVGKLQAPLESELVYGNYRIIPTYG
jgi:uncharacterized phiE125 gp8 family phage protein